MHNMPINKDCQQGRPARRLWPIGKSGLVWILIIVLTASAAGMGIVLKPLVDGSMSMDVKQTITIDADNFSYQDVGKAAKRKQVSFNKDKTGFGVAAEFATGDELVLDIPLINNSKNDAKVFATIDAQSPIISHIEVFWNTLFRSTTPVEQITTPDPPPVTATNRQSSDVVETTVRPVGIAALTAQEEDSTLTYTAPVGLTANPTQTSDGVTTNIQPAGTAPVIAQTQDAAVTYAQPTGTADIAAAVYFDGAGLQPAGSSDGAGEITSSVVDASADVGTYTSIAAVDASRVHVSYYDSDNEALKYTRTTDGGSTWSNQTIDSSDEVGTYNSIAAVNNSIFVSYFDATNNNLRFRKSVDGGLTWPGGPVVVDSLGDVGTDTSIAAADANTIFISYFLSYYDDGLFVYSGDLKFAKSTDGGLTWLSDPFIQTTVDSLGDVGTDTSIFALNASTIFISYYDITNGNLKFAKSTDGGFSWSNKTVDAPGDVGIHTSITARDASNIYISYYDVDNSHLKFARSTDGGVNWVISEADATDGTGQHSSIAAAGTGDLFISYFDAPEGTLNMAASSDNGTTWDISTVDDLGLVGDYTSIDAIDADTLFISYRDIGGKALRVAKSVQSRTFYPGIFSVDVDGNGTIDNLDYVLTDLGSDGTINRMEISNDATFGEGVLDNLVVGTGNDELFDAGNGTSTSRNIFLGAYEFTVTFQHALSGVDATASLKNKTWYTGYFTIDEDADDATDNLEAFAMSDTNSNGLYETMDISADDDIFGEGTLSDQVAGEDEDERINTGEDVLLGDFYTFTAAFTSAPSTVSPDASLTSKTWFTATVLIDADLDGFVDDPINFAMVDIDSDGIYEVLDISLNDVTFGQGNLADDTVITGNDEQIIAATDVNYGTAPWRFATAFDSNPGNDTNDIYMTSQSRFTGNFVFDADADGDTADPEDILYFVLSDTDGDGTYDTMDLSLGDETFGDGFLHDEWLQITNDERITATTDIRIGLVYAIQAVFTANPLAGGNDASILLVTKDGSPVAFPNFTGWFIDADGDETADDRIYFVLSDTDSDGVVDTIDISIGDEIYGEGDLGDGAIDFSEIDNINDESIAYTDMPYLLRMGLHLFLVTADTAIFDDEDAHITSRWYVGTFPVDVDGDQLDDTLDFVQVDSDSDGLFETFELDGNNNDAYEANEVHSESGILVDLEGHRMRLYYRLNPTIANSAELSDSKIYGIPQIVHVGSNKWVFTVPADADFGGVQTEIRVKLATPDDITPGYYRATITLEQS